MTPLRATIRLQLHSGFTFDHAAALTPYFTALGVSHLYLSPILTARVGSMHGYDVVDPTRVNPELGGEEAFRRLVREARRNGLGIIVDIVPNHLAIGSDNRWWMDVLARGRESRFAKYFDIDWTPDNPNLCGKVALPILGKPYSEALAAGEITVRCGKNEPSLVCYFEHRLPLAAASAAALADPHGDFDPASLAGKKRLSELLDSQHYRLMWWRTANDEINWRRFFDINELAAVRVEDDEIFEAVHATILRLYADGLIDGLRVDHIDGLSQPGAYCRKLRQRLRSLERERPDDCPKGPAYLVVEKILSHDETLPKGWETDGTTGYDFMDEISLLQHDAHGECTLEKLWERASGRSADFAAEEKLARREILQRSFAAQHEAAVRALYEIVQADLSTRDVSRKAIGRCFTEILAHFPAYRTCAEVNQASPADNLFLSRALADAKMTCLPGDRWLVDILGDWLSGKRIRPETDSLQALAMRRFQQLSAPLCAKAVEDTAFYRYGRLISRNDVGFDARLFSCSIPEFHERMQARAKGLPLAMLATATHDHKRGEDVRARLAVLSELGDEWSHAVKLWLRLAAPRLRQVDGIRMPHEGDLAILFQTIVGTWPHGLATNDEPGLATYAARLTAWQQKALREAKLWSDWSEPNEVYESAAADFIQSLFAEPSDLLNEIAAFTHRIAAAGAANSLAQTLIKFTTPGVPDIYQGTEYWDLSLVDPDNRAPVDFATRHNTLDDSFPAELAATWRDGRIKQSTIARILAARKNAPLLFLKGRYAPLQTTGPLASHIVAFARMFEGGFAIVAASRLCVCLLSDESSLAPLPERWQTTGVVTPTFLRNAVCFSALHRSKEIHLDAILAAGEIFQDLPIAFLIGANGGQKN
jgi:(1->4)-alpha-D-glucan 1-alpha-D-glucosylmutase